MSENDLAVSVDVEDWYHVPAVTGSSFSRYSTVQEFFADWEGRYDYLTDPTHRTLDLLDEFGITATFFIVADLVDNYPGLVEEISDRGHEIGCHGLHHECAIDSDTKQPRFSRAEYHDRIETAKRKLESATQRSVTGFRAPGGYVAGWMLDVLEDIGFTYDSSVSKNSLYNKTDSQLRNVSTYPYVPKKGSLEPSGDRQIVEVPWPYLDTRVAKLPTAGGPLIRLFGKNVIKYGVSQSLKRGDTVFYFHPIDISRDDFPRIGNTKRRPFYWTGKGKRAEQRICRVLSETSSRRRTTCQQVSAKHNDINNV